MTMLYMTEEVDTSGSGDKSPTQSPTAVPRNLSVESFARRRNNFSITPLKSNHGTSSSTSLSPIGAPVFSPSHAVNVDPATPATPSGL